MGIQYEKQRAKYTSLCYARNNISIAIKLTINNNPLQSAVYLIKIQLVGY